MLDVGTEQFLLTKLFEDTPMTEQQLSASVEAAGISIDRPPNYIAQWCQSAAERGLIEPIANRWSITDAGRKQIGNDPER
jgi:hypothetical protein